jgi:putative redox protein
MTTIRQATLRHEGGMRFTTETATGRRIVFGEDRAGNELSPVETLVAAMAACSAMDVVSIALKKRQGLDRYEIHVRAEQRDEPYPQVLTLVELTHEVEGTDLDREAIRRCVLLSAEKYCPINAMVSDGVTEVHHRMRIVRPGHDAIDEAVIVTGPFRSTESTPAIDRA